MLRSILAALLPLCAFSAVHAQRVDDHAPRAAVTFFKDRKRTPDQRWQAELRQRGPWRNFLAAHPRWRVEFNEWNQKPHRAYGPPITTTGATALDRATNFLQGQLAEMNVPMEELVMREPYVTGKHTYVHFAQRHEGRDVLFAHGMVKLDQQGRVICFGLDVENMENASATPLIDEAAAVTAASAGLMDITATDASAGLAWLPVPAFRSMEHHLVHQVVVSTGAHGTPARWRCLVDAADGRLLYRHNEVMTEDLSGNDAGADVTITGTISMNPLQPTSQQAMRNLALTVGGQPFTTDDNGFAASGLTGPVSYNAPLAGDWSIVATAGNTPTLTGSLLEGANAVNFNGVATLQERSAYFHVNNIHDHMKAVLPSFTGMDSPLPTNVDLFTDNCNAFYDGSSINFYAEANDCYSMATIADVPYHEYGHGINDKFYQSVGEAFVNGGMGEGYADVWAFSITLDPVLALGFTISNPASFIRRYDANKKVYPVDITGEVHADGEIIAGAWWDTYLQLGNDMEHTMQLFAEAYPGVQAVAPDGQEGQAFRDVLIDVLQADDDDGNLINGTPNGIAISEAFRIHGITLLAGFDIEHTPILTAAGSTPITLTATAPVDALFDQYVQGVQVKYRVNTGAWQSMMMTDMGGDNYEAQIPGQPVGTVIAYYVGLLDISNVLSSETPTGAAQPDPNLPNYVLVGYDLERTEDVDSHNELGNWQLGMPGDNNTTGTWELFDPDPTFSTVDGSIIQTGDQHTPGGEYCFFTGNGFDPNTPGENDVDGGKTTLQSYPIDLSGYENPTFTLWRWYTNSPPGGANPGQDWWYVQVTANGNDWVFVENTRTDDRSWRRLAFRVQDHVTPTSTFAMRFIASDSTHLGQNLDGGSLVEAAVDDIQLWDNTTVGIEELSGASAMSIYPDPANDHVNLMFRSRSKEVLQLHILDASGREVRTTSIAGNGGVLRSRVDVSSLAPGGYIMDLRWQGGAARKPFTVLR